MTGNLNLEPLNYISSVALPAILYIADVWINLEFGPSSRQHDGACLIIACDKRINIGLLKNFDNLPNRFITGQTSVFSYVLVSQMRGNEHNEGDVWNLDFC